MVPNGKYRYTGTLHVYADTKCLAITTMQIRVEYDEEQSDKSIVKTLYDYTKTLDMFAGKKIVDI